MQEKVPPSEPPRTRPSVWNPRRIWRQRVVVIGVITAYIAFYFPVRTSIGPIVNAFGLIPAGIVAWLFGLRAGLLACSVIVPFNMLLSYFAGMWTASNLAVTQDLLGNALIVVIAAVIGRMKDLQERVKLEFSEVQRAEAALQVSEQYARSIVDSSLDMIITVDGDRRIVEFNKAAERAFGYTREQILGKPISILYANYDEEESVYRTAFEEAEAVQEVSNRRKNGEIFTSSLTTATMRNEKGKLLGLVGVSRDITQRKQAEEDLKREVGRLNALHEIDRALSTLDLQACLRIIVERTCALFGTTAVALLLQEGEVLRLVAQAGLESTGTDLLIPLGRGLTGWCFEQRQSVLVADIREDARYISGDSRTRAEMVAPLLVQDDCIGVLNVEGEQVDAFAAADLKLLESFAARAAAAIKNARLHKAEREQRQFAQTLRDFGLALT